MRQSFLDAPLRDPDMDELLSEGTIISTLIEVEVMLAKVQAKLDLIPQESASMIEAAAGEMTVAPDDLVEATMRDGVPIPALVAKLRKAAGVAADHVHLGATSQDILDTARALRCKAYLELCEGRLTDVTRNLACLADDHRGTILAGRTRTQQAVPISFGYKAAGWLAPLLRHRDRLAELRPRLLMVQFGGAAGTLSAFGGKGPEVAAALAEALDLVPADTPWHTQRDGPVEFGGWLAGLTGSLGKIGADLMLLTQTEVAEVTVVGGGSSAMPQKSNPILAEALVAAARLSGALQGGLLQALPAPQERGGVEMMVEEAILPQLMTLTGGALRNTRSLLTGLRVSPERMRQNMTDGVFAEAATRLLIGKMDRADALELVKIGLASGDLLSYLSEHADIDGENLADPSNHLGAANTFIDRVLARV